MANAASTGVSAGTSLGETRINSSSSESQKEAAITSDSEGVLVFEQSDLGLNLVAASESTILSTITTLLGTTSSNSLTGDGQVAAGSAITDSLIVLFSSGVDGSGSGTVITRYDENADGDADNPFTGKLSLVAILDGVTSIDNANIV